jgi:hypothetical protein
MENEENEKLFEDFLSIHNSAKFPRKLFEGKKILKLLKGRRK